MSDDRFVRRFSTLGLGDLGTVGGKNASLGELYAELTPLGVRIPNGFAITADAYRHVLDEAKAWQPLRESLAGLDPNDVDDLAARARRAREIVYGAPLPQALGASILEAYHDLEREYGESLSVAVRSSATAEDLPSASFAGQHDTFLNVCGDDPLLEACRRCFASLFTDRAIHYRVHQGFDHFEIGLSIGVMKMVRSDLAASGVIFTLDTESGFRDVVLVTGAYGLGENIVQGTVNPDEFMVFKPTFAEGHRQVLRRELGTKKLQMIYASEDSKTTQNIPTPAVDRERYCITDAEVLTLAEHAIAVERHYSARAGESRPMDLEWAKDGLDGELYILQARPETVVSRKSPLMLEEYTLTGSGPLLAKGRAVGTQVASGRTRTVSTNEGLSDFQPGEILVADATSPDWEPVLESAAGIVPWWVQMARPRRSRMEASSRSPARRARPGGSTAVPCPSRSKGRTSVRWLDPPRASCSISQIQTSHFGRASCRTTAWVSLGWNSSSTTRSAFTPWRSRIQNRFATSEIRPRSAAGPRAMHDRRTSSSSDCPRGSGRLRPRSTRSR
jgi:pyruvate,water dikinase